MKSMKIVMIYQSKHYFINESWQPMVGNPKNEQWRQLSRSKQTLLHPERTILVGNPESKIMMTTKSIKAYIISILKEPMTIDL